jgi:hypothetical protein
MSLRLLNFSLQDVPTEQLMQIRKQVQEEAQYFNESFQQLRMAQS